MPRGRRTSACPRSHTYAWRNSTVAVPRFLAARPRSAEEVALARHDELRRAAVSPHVDAAHPRGRDPAGLAEHELRRTGDLVRDRDLGRAQLVARGVARAAEVAKRRQARNAERDIGRPLA